MDEYLAEIRLFAGTFAPRNWMFCEGQILSINTYQSLYSLLGTNFGGDGRTSFALPDLRGRAPINQGAGIGTSSYPIGAQGGQIGVTLTEAEMPSHNHFANVTNSILLNVAVNSGNADSEDPSNRFFGSNQNGDLNYATTHDSSTLNPSAITGNANTSVTVNGAGGNQSHENRQPIIAINYIICISGIFPSRS